MQETPDSPPDFSTMAPPATAVAQPDRRAEKEDQFLGDPRKAAHNEVYRLTIRALRFGAWMLAAVVMIRIWHLAGPYALPWDPDFKLRWLTDEDIQSMDKMLFSSALGGLVLGHLKEITRPLDKGEP